MLKEQEFPWSRLPLEAHIIYGGKIQKRLVINNLSQ